MRLQFPERARSFDAWAGNYDRYRPGYPDVLFNEIWTRLALPEHPRVVDLGAGTGRASLAMAALGWRVTAVEPGKPMLDVLRAHAANQGLVLATVQATAEATGLDPASADLGMQDIALAACPHGQVFGIRKVVLEDLHDPFSPLAHLLFSHSIT